jgi:hypothetical protein
LFGKYPWIREDTIIDAFDIATGVPVTGKEGRRMGYFL